MQIGAYPLRVDQAQSDENLLEYKKFGEAAGFANHEHDDLHLVH